jgi:hypothetical protein
MPQLSFRRTSGLVLTGNPEVMLKMDFQRRYPEVGLGEIAVISSKPV